MWAGMCARQFDLRGSTAERREQSTLPERAELAAAHANTHDGGGRVAAGRPAHLHRTGLDGGGLTPEGTDERHGRTERAREERGGVLLMSLRGGKQRLGRGERDGW